MGLLGTIAQVGASIFGGVSASKAAKKAKKNVEAQREKNQNWYDRRYNEDATQRADAQNILTQTQELLKNQTRQAAGNAAVMGASEESIAATKAANSQAIANATAQIAANADSRKDNIEATYLQNDNAYTEQLNQIEQNKAKNIAQATQAATSGLGGIGLGSDTAKTWLGKNL